MTHLLQVAMDEHLRQYINSDRRDFAGDLFDIDHVHPDPVKQFAEWFDRVKSMDLPDPYAFVLATAGADGMPSGRVLYMRDLSDKGLTFFTNYLSEKGRELRDNPRASCIFFWPQLFRQVRISGSTEKADEATSDAYFNSRPRESRIGAWASMQSAEIKGRDELEQSVADYTRKFQGMDVPRPPHWGGYVLKPESFEFWQGRESRLHDRILYERQHGKAWTIKRLSP